MNAKQTVTLLLLFAASTVMAGCGAMPSTPPSKPKVGLMIDSGSENDKSFNEYTLEGARKGAADAGLEFTYLTPDSEIDYESQI